MPSWRLIGLVVLLAAYALLAHALLLHAAGEPWVVAALFGPLLVPVAGIAFRRRHAPTLMACAALFLLLVAVVAWGGVADVSRLYVMQHAGIHLALAWGFGVTLRRGSTAVITVLAEQVHGGISSAMRGYTRRLTQVWVAYFVSMALASIVLYAWAPWAWWSLFANLLTPMAAAALFVAEYGLRYRWHPDFERASMAQAVAAYRRFAAAREARQ